MDLSLDYASHRVDDTGMIDSNECEVIMGSEVLT